ncbi:hypothetical protein NADFUDRAFT_45115 [Nadsonia fulvescens var. elongata DSM 6958]|uniref:Uncharacterized protein n=1 Tax=Nadsonia fulvescens var. elongata DSM 6958 TaxID=857566 RepID=A0A1E3PTL5_9ASCO|nr:hypothetical protein NADFUDRAFT_45115 [Nadsonia fulvescens var. elongata DSM 6958]
MSSSDNINLDLAQLLELTEKCLASTLVSNEFDALALFIHLALTRKFLDGYRLENAKNGGTELKDDWCEAGPNYYGFSYDLVTTTPSSPQLQSHPLVLVLSKLGTDIISVNAVFEKQHEASVFINIYEYLKSSTSDRFTSRLSNSSSSSSLVIPSFASSPVDSSSEYASSTNSSSVFGTLGSEKDSNRNMKRYSKTLGKARPLEKIGSDQNGSSSEESPKTPEELESMIAKNTLLKHFISVEKINALLSRIDTSIIEKLNLPVKSSTSTARQSSPSTLLNTQNIRESFESTNLPGIKSGLSLGRPEEIRKARTSVPSADLIPPGFDDEYQMNQAFSPPQSSSTDRSSFPSIGSGDLNPPFLPGAGPRIGESSSSSRAPAAPGMHPRLSDIESSFTSPDYANIGDNDNSFMNPKGARWDPVAPGGPLGPGGPGRRGPMNGPGGLNFGFDEDNLHDKLGGNRFRPGGSGGGFGNNGFLGGFGGGFGGSGGGGFI